MGWVILPRAGGGIVYSGQEVAPAASIALDHATAMTVLLQAAKAVFERACGIAIWPTKIITDDCRIAIGESRAWRCRNGWWCHHLDIAARTDSDKIHIRRRSRNYTRRSLGGDFISPIILQLAR
jgi:hypothetical protein